MGVGYFLTESVKYGSDGIIIIIITINIKLMIKILFKNYNNNKRSFINKWDMGV